MSERPFWALVGASLVAIAAGVAWLASRSRVETAADRFEHMLPNPAPGRVLTSSTDPAVWMTFGTGCEPPPIEFGQAPEPEQPVAGKGVVRMTWVPDAAATEVAVLGQDWRVRVPKAASASRESAIADVRERLARALEGSTCARVGMPPVERADTELVLQVLDAVAGAVPDR